MRVIRAFDDGQALATFKLLDTLPNELDIADCEILFGPAHKPSPSLSSACAFEQFAPLSPTALKLFADGMLPRLPAPLQLRSGWRRNTKRQWRMVLRIAAEERRRRQRARQ